MCADYVTCFDEDEHIYSDVWEGPGPNYYYRDKIMTLINEFLEKELMDMDGVDDRRDDSGKYEVSHD